jgi:hypothetical protein
MRTGRLKMTDGRNHSIDKISSRRGSSSGAVLRNGKIEFYSPITIAVQSSIKQVRVSLWHLKISTACNKT